MLLSSAISDYGVCRCGCPTKDGLSSGQKENRISSGTVEPPHNPAPALPWLCLN